MLCQFRSPQETRDNVISGVSIVSQYQGNQHFTIIGHHYKKSNCLPFTTKHKVLVELNWLGQMEWRNYILGWDPSSLSFSLSTTQQSDLGSEAVIAWWYDHWWLDSPNSPTLLCFFVQLGCLMLPVEALHHYHNSLPKVDFIVESITKAQILWTAVLNHLSSYLPSNNAISYHWPFPPKAPWPTFSPRWCIFLHELTSVKRKKYYRTSIISESLGWDYKDHQYDRA